MPHISGAASAPQRMSVPLPAPPAGGPHRAVPTSAAIAAVPAPAHPSTYDRHEWESALQASDLYQQVRLVGLVLAHHAGPVGYLPEAGIQSLPRLSRLAALPRREAKLGLRDLERAGFIWREPVPPGRLTQLARPLTLTMPPARG